MLRIRDMRLKDCKMILNDTKSNISKFNRSARSILLSTMNFVENA